MFVLKVRTDNWYFWYLKPFGVDIPTSTGFKSFDVGKIPLNTDILAQAKRWKTRRGAENYLVRQLRNEARAYEVVKL